MAQIGSSHRSSRQRRQQPTDPSCPECRLLASRTQLDLLTACTQLPSQHQRIASQRRTGIGDNPPSFTTVVFQSQSLRRKLERHPANHRPTPPSPNKFVKIIIIWLCAFVGFSITYPLVKVSPSPRQSIGQETPTGTSSSLYFTTRPTEAPTIASTHIPGFSDLAKRSVPRVVFNSNISAWGLEKTSTYMGRVQTYTDYNSTRVQGAVQSLLSRVTMSPKPRVFVLDNRTTTVGSSTPSDIPTLSVGQSPLVIPSGWSSVARPTNLYAVPVIIATSVILAAIVITAIVCSVLYRRAIRKKQKEKEKRRKERRERRRAASSPDPPVNPDGAVSIIEVQENVKEGKFSAFQNGLKKRRKFVVRVGAAGVRRIRLGKRAEMSEKDEVEEDRETARFTSDSQSKPKRRRRRWSKVGGPLGALGTISTLFRTPSPVHDSDLDSSDDEGNSNLQVRTSETQTTETASIPISEASIPPGPSPPETSSHIEAHQSLPPPSPTPSSNSTLTPVEPPTYFSVDRTRSPRYPSNVNEEPWHWPGEKGESSAQPDETALPSSSHSPEEAEDESHIDSNEYRAHVATDDKSVLERLRSIASSSARATTIVEPSAPILEEDDDNDYEILPVVQTRSQSSEGISESSLLPTPGLPISYRFNTREEPIMGSFSPKWDEVEGESYLPVYVPRNRVIVEPTAPPDEEEEEDPETENPTDVLDAAEQGVQPAKRLRKAHGII